MAADRRTVLLIGPASCGKTAFIDCLRDTGWSRRRRLRKRNPELRGLCSDIHFLEGMVIREVSTCLLCQSQLDQHLQRADFVVFCADPAHGIDELFVLITRVMNTRPQLCHPYRLMLWLPRLARGVDDPSEVARLIYEATDVTNITDDGTECWVIDTMARGGRERCRQLVAHIRAVLERKDEQIADALLASRSRTAPRREPWKRRLLRWVGRRLVRWGQAMGGGTDSPEALVPAGEPEELAQEEVLGVLTRRARRAIAERREEL